MLRLPEIGQCLAENSHRGRKRTRGTLVLGDAATEEPCSLIDVAGGCRGECEKITTEECTRVCGLRVPLDYGSAWVLCQTL